MTKIRTDILQDIVFGILKPGRLLTLDKLRKENKFKVSYNIVLVVPTIRIRIK